MRTREGPDRHHGVQTPLSRAIRGESKTLVFPQGAKGDKEILQRLQDLPGFNNEAVIEAMGSTEKRIFLCWEKRLEPVPQADTRHPRYGKGARPETY